MPHVTYMAHMYDLSCSAQTACQAAGRLAVQCLALHSHCWPEIRRAESLYGYSILSSKCPRAGLQHLRPCSGLGLLHVLAGGCLTTDNCWHQLCSLAAVFNASVFNASINAGQFAPAYPILMLPELGTAAVASLSSPAVPDTGPPCLACKGRPQQAGTRQGDPKRIWEVEKKPTQLWKQACLSLWRFGSGPVTESRDRSSCPAPWSIHLRGLGIQYNSDLMEPPHTVIPLQTHLAFYPLRACRAACVRLISPGLAKKVTAPLALATRLRCWELHRWVGASLKGQYSTLFCT